MRDVLLGQGSVGWHCFLFSLGRERIATEQDFRSHPFGELSNLLECHLTIAGQLHLALAARVVLIAQVKGLAAARADFQYQSGRVATRHPIIRFPFSCLAGSSGTESRIEFSFWHAHFLCDGWLSAQDARDLPG
jgi:hypothetical protein